jgi:hypothetical protein
VVDDALTVVGDASTAVGDASTAVGDASTAVGDPSTVVDDALTVVGDASTAVGDASTAVGDPSTVVGDASTAVGDASTAVGDASTTPAPPKPEPVRRPAKVAQQLALALAHHPQSAIDRGEIADRAALARSLSFTRARITQLLELLPQRRTFRPSSSSPKPSTAPSRWPPGPSGPWPTRGRRLSSGRRGWHCRVAASAAPQV